MKAGQGWLEVDVDSPIVSPNRLTHEHWRSRHRRRRRERAAVRNALSGTVPPPGPRWEVTFARVGPRRVDDDNLAAAFKTLRDELAAWLGVNDRDPRVTWSYGQAIERVRVPMCERVTPQGRASAFRVWARLRVEVVRDVARPTAAEPVVSAAGRCAL